MLVWRDTVPKIDTPIDKHGKVGKCIFNRFCQYVPEPGQSTSEPRGIEISDMGWSMVSSMITARFEPVVDDVGLAGRLV